MTTEERIAAIRADLNGASGVARNGERIRSAHAHLDAIQAHLRSLTDAAQVAANALDKCNEFIELSQAVYNAVEGDRYALRQYDDLAVKSRDFYDVTALSLLAKNGVVPGGG